jgi:fatty acid desaturase
MIDHSRGWVHTAPMTLEASQPAPRVPPRSIFSDVQWARLTNRSDWIGMGLVAHAWSLIVLAVAVHAFWPNPLTWALAVMIVGARQLGLAILMHEAAHGGLSSNLKLNDFLGQWLTGVPVGADLTLYRPYHLAHHKFTQQANDPDLGLAAHFPIRPESFRRKMIRDLTGQTFFKQQIAPFGRIIRGQLHHARAAVHGRWLAAQVVIFTVFALSGQAWAFFSIWMVAQASWYPMVTRIRNIGEHACATPDRSDPWKLARTTHANWIERLLIAPYWVHFHAEHHLWMHIPCYRLEEAHAMLAEKGLTAKMEVQPGYAAILALATRQPT